MTRLTLCSVLFLVASASATPTYTGTDRLPIVDLGYEVHQAISYNDTFGFYTFSNIPFAQPPVGDLRFAAPQPPLRNEDRTPKNGSGIKICPQATTGWGEIAYNFYLNYTVLQAGVLTGQVNATAAGALLDRIPITDEGVIPPFPEALYTPEIGESEDCLYLDVLVPRAVLEGRRGGRRRAKAPVLVEIYGGAFIGGNKVSVGFALGEGSPAGLLQRSNDSVIYVAMNYRVGAFGFLAGPEFQGEGGQSNAGLLDQRAAIEWVQKYIHLFGGDGDDVTLIGESAGGSSIEHQITAYGGSQGPVPFKRAISQSPGFVPTRSNNYTDTTYQDFLRYANATSLAELRQADTATLFRANAHQVWDTQAIGSGTYGPVVDGDFVPDLPGILFRDGHFDRKVEIRAGQNANEGSFFTSPLLSTDEAIIEQLTQLFGEDQQDAYEYVVSNLYPAVYDGSQPYTNWYQRAMLLVSEFAFICNDYYMTSGNANKSYGYQFNIFPGFHGQDTAYTFYAGTPVNASLAAVTQVNNASAAYTLQDWILSFARDGVPESNVPLSVDLPLYASNETIGSINVLPGLGFGAVIRQDPANNDRCRWWQEGLYAPAL